MRRGNPNFHLQAGGTNPFRHYARLWIQLIEKPKEIHSNLTWLEVLLLLLLYTNWKNRMSRIFPLFLHCCLFSWKNAPKSAPFAWYRCLWLWLWLFTEHLNISYLKSIKNSSKYNFLLIKAKNCAGRSKSWKIQNLKKNYYYHGSWQLQKLKTWVVAYQQYPNPYVEFFLWKSPKGL